MEPNDLGTISNLRLRKWIPKLDNECQIGIAGSECEGFEEELAGVKGDRMRAKKH